MDRIELEQAFTQALTAFDQERSALEDLLALDYFKNPTSAALAGVRGAVDQVEHRRELAVTLLDQGPACWSTPEEVGRVGAAVSFYGDELSYLRDMLSPVRNDAEQHMRQQVHGPMSDTYDDLYGTSRTLAKKLNLPEQNIDNLTDDAWDALLGLSGQFANQQVRMRDTLEEIDKARRALNFTLAAELAAVRTQVRALRLEKILSDLRSLMDPSTQKIAIR